MRLRPRDVRIVRPLYDEMILQTSVLQNNILNLIRDIT